MSPAARRTAVTGAMNFLIPTVLHQIYTPRTSQETLRRSNILNDCCIAKLAEAFILEDSKVEMNDG
jgi:hypothetical protein